MLLRYIDKIFLLHKESQLYKKEDCQLDSCILFDYGSKDAGRRPKLSWFQKTYHFNNIPQVITQIKHKTYTYVHCLLIYHKTFS